MTPQEIQGAILGGGQHSGTLGGGGAALLGAGSCRVFVHRVGDSSALGGHPCHDGGHQDDTTGWASPLGGTGGTGGESAASCPTCRSQEWPPAVQVSVQPKSPEPADAGWEPSECHKHSVTRLGSNPSMRSGG